MSNETPGVPGEWELLRSALTADLHIDATDLSATADSANFHVRIEGHFGRAEPADEDDAADDLRLDGDEEWAAIPVIFALGLYSFLDAGARGSSVIDFKNEDGWTASDMAHHLRYERGELRFYADYVRGRCMKTRIIVRPDGTFELDTVNRGDAALRWIQRLQGKDIATHDTAN